MSTWLTHLRVAEKLLPQLEGVLSLPFYVGSIAPDSGRMVGDFIYLPPKDVSHWKREGVSYSQRFDDNAEFYEKFARNEQDIAKFSFYLGYYVHILTDTIYVRDIIHPFIEKHGKPFWKENITAIRKGWYEIDFRYLAENKDFSPLAELKSVKEFTTKTLDYFAQDDVYLRIVNATELYTDTAIDPDCAFFTHTPTEADALVGNMVEEIAKILKNKHKI